MSYFYTSSTFSFILTLSIMLYYSSFNKFLEIFVNEIENNYHIFEL